MNELTFEIVRLLIRILAAVVTIYLVPAIKQWITVHAENEKLYALMRWAKEAVYAAEQIHGAGTGQERKQYAAHFLWEIAQKNNINITEDQINLLLEAAVGEMNAFAIDFEEPKEEQG